MLFNSAVFFKFFAAFGLLYFLVRNNLRARNGLILVASYVFYGWWNYYLLTLLLFSTVLDYTLGLAIDASKSSARRKWLLAASVTGNLGILGFFKYYDFFVESFRQLLQQTGLPFHPGTLDIILPVGISFYTFQTMSYTIDVYRRQVRPTRDFLAMAAYVSFFPQLVAGPIERARHLLPQFQQTRTITRPMVEEGVWLCCWGLFKKVVIADNLAPLVDLVYGSPNPSSMAVILGTAAFGLQIYCDFSGYSDMARGLARLLGFDIMVNFQLPYAARDVREFWHRWHISLSTWLRDYLYIPLGGNRRGPGRTASALMVTMLLGGLWHGAAWHFVLWGFYHGLGLIVHRAWTLRRNAASGQPSSSAARAGFSWPCLLSWALTMAFVFYGWLLFRAEGWSHILELTVGLARGGAPGWLGDYAQCLLAFSLPLVLLEFCQWRSADRLVVLRWPRWTAALLEGILLWFIILYWQKEGTNFIYFQF